MNQMVATAFLTALLTLAARAEAGEKGTGPPGAFAFLQEFVHGPMAPHENPRDLVQIRVARQDVAESGGKRLVTVLPPGCGMTMLEPLPREEAVERLRALFALYGIAALPDQSLDEAGAKGRLDGYDPATKTGFVLVRGAFKPRGREDPVLRARPPLAADEELTLDECRTLARRGHNILRVPEDRFVGLPPNRFVPLLACLLDAADWLNGVTEGPELDVDFLLSAPRATRIPDFVAANLPLAQPIQQDDSGIFLVTSKAAGAQIQLAPVAKEAPARRAPGLVVVPFSWLPPHRTGGYDFSEAALEFELIQQTTPTQRLRVLSGRPVFLVPPAFDPAKPFRVRLVLPHGQVTLSREVTLLMGP